jgi:hypothetical protein
LRERQPSLTLDVNRYLDQAEREFLLHGRTEFLFPVRRPPGDADFYQRLDKQLLQQSLLRVHSFREVKEGFTRVSRPAALFLDLETLLRERPTVSLWRGEIDNLVQSFPFLDLRSFLRSEGSEILNDLGLLRACLEVLSYMISHRAEIAGLLPRQLPHGQSTKLIGRENLLLKLFNYWSGKNARWSDFFVFFEILDKPLEFRFFAPSCQFQGHVLERFHGLLAKDWRHELDFRALSGSLIVENFESFLALTRESRLTLLIWGAGWRAVHLRFLFESLPQPIYYWGDIDKEGYEIFAHLKSSISSLKPILMDQRTVDRYLAIHQRKDVFIGPFREVPGLQKEYEYVSRQGIQIEQEQIREVWPFGTSLA